MHKLHTLPVITLILGIIAIGIAAYVLLLGKPLPAVEPDAASKVYTSDEYGISFEYSPVYYLTERDSGASGRPQLALVLVEDTAENRDVIEGRSETAREGPTAITVEVYPNRDELPAQDWVRSDTNWTVRTSDAAPFGRGAITGITYTWDGLYSGKSVIATKGSRAYVFSVTFLTSDDAILAEFDRVLASVRLADPEVPVVSIEDYVRANIGELAPEDEVLGGTFYVTAVAAENGSGVVSYEDGHNAFTADFTYVLDEAGRPEVRSFTVR